jgi:ABC-2 type transport system ATP-binding protein
LLSTHILQEVAAVCTRVILIHEGRIVFDGTVQEMADSAPEMDKRFRELTGAGKSRH